MYLVCLPSGPLTHEVYADDATFFVERDTMRKKATKGYWSKKKERFTSSQEARKRASTLRNDEYTAHVQVLPSEDAFIVSYSIPKWYEADLKSAGIRL